ncbi:MAG: hypothetical protein NUV84_02870 [Candidatus Uhrbacteria bacterium]|nr:hypothetical protein [Candidatus Uhrbacteria bacterium]
MASRHGSSAVRLPPSPRAERAWGTGSQFSICANGWHGRNERQIAPNRGERKSVKKFSCVRIAGTIPSSIAGPGGSMIQVIDLRPIKGASLAELVIEHNHEGVPCAIVLRQAPQGTRPSLVFFADSTYIKSGLGWKVWVTEVAFLWRAVTGSSGSGHHRTENLSILAREITEQKIGKGGGDVQQYRLDGTTERSWAPNREPTFTAHGGREQAVEPPWLHEELPTPPPIPAASIWGDLPCVDAQEWAQREVPTDPVGVERALAALEQGERIRPVKTAVARTVVDDRGYEDAHWAHNTWSRENQQYEIVTVDQSLFQDGTALRSLTPHQPGANPVEALIADLGLRAKRGELDQEQKARLQALGRAVAEARARVIGIVDALSTAVEHGSMPAHISTKPHPYHQGETIDQEIPASMTPEASFAELVLERMQSALELDPRLAVKAWDDALSPPEFVIPTPPPALKEPTVEVSKADLDQLFGGNTRRR